MYTIYISTPHGRRIHSTCRDEQTARLRSLELEHAGVLACYDRTPGC